MITETPFASRHIGPSADEQKQMVAALPLQKESLKELIDTSVPKNILNLETLNVGSGKTEAELLREIRHLADQNKVYKSYIGQGYYSTFMPSVIQRNILESPAWYTAYTPYQSEISQGRMEALLNFQTMIIDLTAMDMANASLLDEGTALAEAVSLAHNSQKSSSRRNIVYASDRIFDQSLAVLKTRCDSLGLELKITAVENFEPANAFALCVQYPDKWGEVIDFSKLTKKAQQNSCKTIVAADLLALTYLKPPGEWGADIVVGSTQRFGVPMGLGGPHAAYLATHENLKRLVPGRIIGLSKDADGEPALRLALQTREQHIRREKATSNICTSQVLPAVLASMYAVYHGPEGLRKIAQRIHQFTMTLKKGFIMAELPVVEQPAFDTLTLEFSSADEVNQFMDRAQKKNLNLGLPRQNKLTLSLDETTTVDDLVDLAKVFDIREIDLEADSEIPQALMRTSPFLQHKVFNTHHSETELLRYIYRLQNKDLTLAQAMIPLGSCTMKLNATTEMIPITWSEFANIHPFAPEEQYLGSLKLIEQLEGWLCDITGFEKISLQPNAGSQGEYAGLLAIKNYLESQGEPHRNVCLIPTSAHGTNPASAVMAGMKVVLVNCDEQGNIDMGHLSEKVTDHKNELAALMITYPSTHGVFEESVVDICELIHKNGGQIYMDGANLNALVGISRPSQWGVDVCHLNLHKTFCIPHGGGGPGMGPIGVAKHLADFLPTHPFAPSCGGTKTSITVSSAPWGSPSILPISWAYIAMMGSEGLKRATQVAILNANYVSRRLSEHYSILYRGKNNFVAHECIIDVRHFKQEANITVDDIAKRLMDYGFHAPTMSWPVPGTLMIEPTESESKAELDLFCEAMIEIKKEIEEIKSGAACREDNVLKNAPHSLHHCTKDQWPHSYSRNKAAYPLPWVKERKFWPPVRRVDNSFGDRNFTCSCPPVESYSDRHL